jgi:outer membrane murein-binding lipoprotein Lpp
VIFPRIFPCFAALAALMLAGCASIPARVNGRFDSVPPQVHDFDGTVEQVYAAAKKAFRELDFNVTRTSMGRVEAASVIHTSTAFADSRQLVARIAIHEVGPGKCEVEMWLNEDVSSQSVGGTHSTAVREHGFFATYFAELQQVLQDDPAASAADKK